MNFSVIINQKGSARINAKVSSELKKILVQVSSNLNISESLFIKMAIAEKLEKELNK